MHKKSTEVEGIGSSTKREQCVECRGRGCRVEGRGRGWPWTRKKNRSFSGARAKINTGTIWISYAGGRAEVVRSHPALLTLIFAMMSNMEVVAKI